MRVTLTSLATVVCLAAHGAAWTQPGAKPAGGPPGIRACALLTREMVTQFGTNTNPALLDLIPPQEDRIGESGTGCEYGGIYLQIDPFGRADQMRRSPPKDWQPVSGVGDTAYFRNNRNLFAELMVWSGARHFTIQMSVPTGGTAETVKPKAIAMANALIPKLR